MLLFVNTLLYSLQASSSFRCVVVTWVVRIALNTGYGEDDLNAHIDVRVFNPFAPSNRSSSVSAAYTRHEKAKNRSYEQRLRDVEHASFVPAVFSTTGGMSKCASDLYKRIAVLLTEKTGESYSLAMAFIRCRLSVALIRASVMCVRGSRYMFSAHAPVASSAAVVAAEASIMADCFHSHTSSFLLLPWQIISLIICHGDPRKSK